MTGGPNQQSTLPHFDVFDNPPPQTMPLVGRPPKQAAAGVGIVPPGLAMISPAAAAVQVVQQQRQAQGVGQTAGPLLGGLVVWAVLLGGGGFLSYQAAKAMAPGGKEKTWGWIGVPVGILTGAFGLGIMGFVANRKG
jgi:hypothetical protein